jgi:hypothetical protein
MVKRRIRLKKEYRVKARIFLLSALILCFIIIPRPHRAAIASFFSRKCINYQQV